MTSLFPKGGLLIGLMGALLLYDMPVGWVKRGSQPDKYDMGIDKRVGQNSGTSATIKSIDKSIDGFGSFMQNSVPGKYSGKRVRMSAYLKTEEATGAGLFLRTDHVVPNQTEDSILVKPLTFGNLHDKQIKGTTDWTKYEIILDIPANTTSMSYGGMLIGTGQIWFDNLKFEIVNQSVPSTEYTGGLSPWKMSKEWYKNRQLAAQPISFSFED